MPKFTLQQRLRLAGIVQRVESVIDDVQISGDDTEPYLALDVLYEGLIELFKETDSNFDEDRFHKACFPSAYDKEGNRI